MTQPFAWITRSLRHQQDVARRNAAGASALCAEERRQREEVEEYLTGLRRTEHRGDLARGPARDAGHA